MQASNKWTPPSGVLGELVRAAEERVRALEGSSGLLRSAAAAATRAPNFRAVLEGRTVAVIAELKRSSPSKGTINPGLDVVAQCAHYDNGGASAISVLTEPSRFGGSLDDLRSARAASHLALLRKDFMVGAIQILEARAAGASAVLLIARAVEPKVLKGLFRTTIENRLDALVEVRDEVELERALAIGASIIGVNNRNLETLEIDDTARRLLPHIPRKCIAVAESGYRTREDVQKAADAGADAVLIGSELSASPDPTALLVELASVKRNRDARPN